MILDPDPSADLKRRAEHRRRLAVRMGQTRCDSCGIDIDVLRAYPLELPCHAVARGMFCLRCYDQLADRHTPHVWMLREPNPE